MREMTIPSSPVPRVKAALVARLRARPGLQSAAVLPFEMKRVADQDYISVMNGSAKRTNTSQGNLRYSHDIRLTVVILVYRPEEANAEAAAISAEERANYLLSELDAELRGSLAGTTLKDEFGESQVDYAEIESDDWDAGFESNQRWHLIRAVVHAVTTTYAA